MMTLAYAPDQGNGASKSHIIFAVTSAQPSSLKCGTPISADFWHSECTSSSKGRHCWTDVTQYTNTSPSVNDCCLKCKANAACNGFTHQHQSGPQGWICGLKSCYDETGSPVEDCLTTPRPNSTVQSALIAGRKRHIVTAAIFGTQFELAENVVKQEGNSISGYDFARHPSSRWWSYARNTMVRVPSTWADRASWTQRETVTTDGSGGSLVLDANMSADITAKHGDTVLINNQSLFTLKILGGPGTGQTRLVTGWDHTTRTLSLESPLDDHFVVGEETGSILTVVCSFGAKAIVGNTFNWTEVVQWYSNTLGGVIADNLFTDCNACYNGPGPVWFTEFVGNTQVRSDGIALLDVPRISSKNGVNQNDCPVYGGVYVRWSVIRRNSIAGISLAQSREKRCGSVSNNNKNSTDLISEHNIIDCPVGGTTINANGKGLNWTDVRCDHGCLTRP
eukprot:gene4002-27673_t